MNINSVRIPVYCDDLRSFIENDEFHYYPQYRGVCLYYKKDNCRSEVEGTEFGEYFLYFCSFCGKKMPEILYGRDTYGQEFGQELEKSMGKSFADIDLDKIPEEFKTDEWWIKRGL